LHGHVHLPPHQKVGQGRSLDVGADGNSMVPYSLDEVLSILRDQPISRLSLSSDHHEI
jgi:calcineurin-like phosphoesterase family protein